ncbi:MAG TPA: hypothetical protein DHV59_15205 [Oxalobacteraceae bacterium]|nr:hypothetical protein [Oxalobacteraceae bacterium]
MRVALLVQDGHARPKEFSTEIYLNEIPVFAGNELQRLYGHVYSSLPFMRIFRLNGRASTYVALHRATPTAILLFRREGRRIVVLNQTMQIDQVELRRFVACMFEQFPFVGVISFKAVQADFSDFPYPLQRGHAMEDIVITLPATVDDYTAGMGKSTRSNLKHYKAKLEKDFSSVSFQSYEKKEIDKQLVYDIIKLSEARITAKKINFGIDSEYARRLVELTKSCGVVNAIWVDGRLCAGAISYRTGADQTTEVIAHDEKYNCYSPGMLCFYLAICESITKGVRKYHLGGGKLDYKVRLSGVQQNMEEVQIYRSYGGMVLNCDSVAKTLFKAGMVRLKTWLHSHETNPAVRLLLQARLARQKFMKGG